MTATYPKHVTRASRRAAERFYARLPHLEVPPGYDLDELIDRSDRPHGGFTAAALPERRTDDDD